MKEYASLIWNVGTILEDRRSGEYGVSGPEVIWNYLYENLDVVYEQIAPVIDRIENALFSTEEPEEEEEEGIPYSKLQAFEKIVITYSGSGDEGYIDDVSPVPSVEDFDISYDLRRELEDEAHSILEKHYAGWEINEGSQGHITIDVAKRKVLLHHGTNREVTDWEDVVV